eukprot:TRINITY_DN10268_c0_g1_i1.p1 TRINITY_DN10268_c0_g1~~TRINITY_DN10268_c0_g1_i1.p1  ORF type:complete len:917 (+),score=240.83 TRINITY_DN10268_c0_g1_i1:71-2821(+)
MEAGRARFLQQLEECGVAVPQAIRDVTASHRGVSLREAVVGRELDPEGVRAVEAAIDDVVAALHRLTKGAEGRVEQKGPGAREARRAQRQAYLQLQAVEQGVRREGVELWDDPDTGERRWLWTLPGLSVSGRPAVTSDTFATFLSHLGVPMPAVLGRHKGAKSTLKDLFASAPPAERDSVLAVVHVILAAFADARAARCFPRCLTLTRLLKDNLVVFDKTHVTLDSLVASGLVLHDRASPRAPLRASWSRAAQHAPPPWTWQGVAPDDQGGTRVAHASTEAELIAAFAAAQRPLAGRVLTSAVTTAVRLKSKAALEAVQRAVLLDPEAGVLAATPYPHVTSVLWGMTKLAAHCAACYDAVAGMVGRRGFTTPDGEGRGEGTAHEEDLRFMEYPPQPPPARPPAERGGAVVQSGGAVAVAYARDLSIVVTAFARAQHPATDAVAAAVLEALVLRGTGGLIGYTFRELAQVNSPVVRQWLQRHARALPLVALTHMLAALRLQGGAGRHPRALEPIVAGALREAIARRGFLLRTFEVFASGGYQLGYQALRAAFEEFARRMHRMHGRPAALPASMADFALLVRNYTLLMQNVGEHADSGPPFPLTGYLHLMPDVVDVGEFAEVVFQLKHAIGARDVAVPSVRLAIKALVDARYDGMEVLTKLSTIMRPPGRPPPPEAAPLSEQRGEVLIPSTADAVVPPQPQRDIDPPGAPPSLTELWEAYFTHYVERTQRAGLRLTDRLRHDAMTAIVLKDAARYYEACARSDLMQAQGGAAEQLRLAVQEEVASMKPGDVARLPLGCLCTLHRYAQIDLGTPILAALGREEGVGRKDLMHVLHLPEMKVNTELAAMVFQRFERFDLTALSNRRLADLLDSAAALRQQRPMLVDKLVCAFRARRAGLPVALLTRSVRAFHKLRATVHL